MFFLKASGQSELFEKCLQSKIKVGSENGVQERGAGDGDNIMLDHESLPIRDNDSNNIIGIVQKKDQVKESKEDAFNGNDCNDESNDTNNKTELKHNGALNHPSPKRNEKNICDEVDQVMEKHFLTGGIKNYRIIDIINADVVENKQFAATKSNDNVTNSRMEENKFSDNSTKKKYFLWKKNTKY